MICHDLTWSHQILPIIGLIWFSNKSENLTDLTQEEWWIICNLHASNTCEWLLREVGHPDNGESETGIDQFIQEVFSLHRRGWFQWISRWMGILDVAAMMMMMFLVMIQCWRWLGGWWITDSLFSNRCHEAPLASYYVSQALPVIMRRRRIIGFRPLGGQGGHDHDQQSQQGGHGNILVNCTWLLALANGYWCWFLVEIINIIMMILTIYR